MQVDMFKPQVSMVNQHVAERFMTVHLIDPTGSEVVLFLHDWSEWDDIVERVRLLRGIS